MGEPFLDANENKIFDVNESYVDSNLNGEFDSTGDHKSSGDIRCLNGNYCSSETFHARASAILIMSSSHATINVFDVDESKLLASNTEQVESNIVDIGGGGGKNILLHITDSAGQIMPKDTRITIYNTAGKLNGNFFNVYNSVGSDAVPEKYSHMNDSGFNLQGGSLVAFSISDDNETISGEGTITIKVITPGGATNKVTLNLVL